jgi:nicotinate-nucleotide adenylyltransferase
MRVGLYGGSFDPVHLAHLLVAQVAREEAQLDRVIFIPAAQSPFKPDRQLTASSLRAAMLRLALAGKPWAEVDPQELERGGVSYTIDTIRTYRDRFPQAELFYLIGGDHVSQLTKWREAPALAQLVQFLIIPRPGQPQGPLPAGFQGTYLRGFPLDLSSSEIRCRLAEGRPVDLLLPSPVAEFIANNRLYL